MLQITLQPLNQLTAEQLATKKSFDCGQPALNNYLINKFTNNEAMNYHKNQLMVQNYYRQSVYNLQLKNNNKIYN